MKVLSRPKEHDVVLAGNSRHISCFVDSAFDGWQ